MILYKHLQLFRKPLHVPLARTLDILDHDLEGIKVESGHRIKRHVEEDQGPLEECVDRVGCRRCQYSVT
jgi:hypothetical protein